MMWFRKYSFSVLILFVAGLSIITDWYAALSITLSCLLVLWLLKGLGHGIVLRETIALFYCVTCLVMPLIGYQFYTEDNLLSRIWVTYMVVPKDEYFSFVLPAVSLFTLSLTFPLKNEDDRDSVLRDSIERIKKLLSINGDSARLIIMLFIGFVFSFVTEYLPEGLKFFAYLISFSNFAVILYVYFSPSFRFKKVVLIVFTLSIFISSLREGMFTTVAFMSLTMYAFFFFGRRVSLYRKVFVFLFGVLFFIVFQNAKTTYRKYIWIKKTEENKGILFSRIFVENFAKGEKLFDLNSFFPIYARGNQGYYIALVMRRIPRMKPYDGGERLLEVVGSAFVPRLFWPDKPEAGGKFNMPYYAGRKLVGYTINVGPIGEAYGSFGVYGGMVYMFLLGWIVRWAYKRVFILGRKYPMVILWIPVLFYQVAYSAENDTLQIVNSLVKISIFIYLVYLLLPWLFRREKYRLMKTGHLASS